MCGGARQARFGLETRDGPGLVESNECGDTVVPDIWQSDERMNGRWISLAEARRTIQYDGTVQESSFFLVEISDVLSGQCRDPTKILLTITIGATSVFGGARRLVMNGGVHEPRINCGAEVCVRPRNRINVSTMRLGVSAFVGRQG